MAESVFEQASVALAEAVTVEDVQRIVRTAARQLVGAQGATFVLLDDGKCFYADEDAISPLWKGQRFPVDQCISGWTMIHGESAVIADIRVDERIPQAAYAPTFVRSLAMVPVGDPPLGAIGAYWARIHRASDEDVAALARLAAVTAAALRRIQVELWAMEVIR